LIIHKLYKAKPWYKYLALPLIFSPLLSKNNFSYLKSMTPSILIVGATGNTGRGVVRTLPNLLQSSSSLTGSCIIALTRSASSPVASLPKYPELK
jgi:hypothetical protein